MSLTQAVKEIATQLTARIVKLERSHAKFADNFVAGLQALDQANGKNPNLLLAYTGTLAPSTNRNNGAPLAIAETLVGGEQYTFSADIEWTQGEDTEVTIYLHPTGNTLHLPVENGKISGSFTLRSSQPTNVYFYSGRSGRTQDKGMIIKNAKLESGNVRTDFCQNYQSVKPLLQATKQ